MSLKKILEPIRIGKTLTVKNRIVRTAHGTHLGDGSMSDDLIAYHVARARGGVGLTILEIFAVHPTTKSRLNGWDPRLDRDYAKLLKAVEPYGMAVFQQLWNGGFNHLPSGVDGNPIKSQPGWSSSDLPSPVMGIAAVPMTKMMIDEMVASYVGAAVRCEQIGLHGVEIHAAHSYLIQQFLSPAMNKREDAYGGSLENRMRFLLEILRGVRSSVRPEFVVGVRLSPDLVEGGLGVADNQAIVERLEAERLIDYLNISMGSYYTIEKIVAGMNEPMGYQLPTSIPIAERSKVVRIASGRFRTLEEAEQALKDAPVDMIGMTRATIADPDVVAKTIAGHPEQVRPCIGCNQGCIQGFGDEGRLACAVNPAVGFERDLDESGLTPAPVRKRVVVVGGGPAGLEAARVAALRGHTVTLFEATSDLGGALNIAARTPTRHGIRDIVVWLESELRRLGVDIWLNTYVEAQDILAESPDAVIVATGASPRMDGIVHSHPGSPIKNFDRFAVLSSTELLAEKRKGYYGGKRAVVIDDTGHYEAIGAAGLPVPQPLWLDTSGALGPPFFVTRRVRGAAPGDPFQAHQALSEDFMMSIAQLMAQLHGRGLEPYDNFLRHTDNTAAKSMTARECVIARVRGWRHFFEARPHFPSAAEIILAGWLIRNAPQSDCRPVIVHGDFNIHNLLVDDGRIAALLDWEFAHIGDPAEDLANLHPHIERWTTVERFYQHYRANGGPEIDLSALGFYSSRANAIFGMSANSLAALISQGQFKSLEAVYGGNLMGFEFLDMSLDAAFGTSSRE